MNIKEKKEKNDKNEKVPKTLTFRIKVVESNIIKNDLNTDNIDLIINNNIIPYKNIDLKEILKDKDYIIYDIIINEIAATGNISLVIKDSIIMDMGNQTNDRVEFVYFVEN